MKVLDIPKDGIAGLRQNWTADMLSGFLVFLVALPLSLAIAEASGFPPVMGVVTAITGGIAASLFGSPLTIKGPAAVLVTVCSGSVLAFGGGTVGWQLTLGAIVVAAGMQIALGLLKAGTLSDFFPRSVIHGMLAGIGLLIFARQFPVLLGVDPSLTAGLSPVELYTHIPIFIEHAKGSIALVGISSLLILLGLPALGGIFTKIPAPMIVLAVAIAMMIFMGPGPATDTPVLIKMGSLREGIALNARFDAIGTLLFWKYVLMFVFTGSLVSLLTVRTVDGLDPYKRRSDYNKDLLATGIGNVLSGLMGGVPMVSEVTHSAANADNGARTRWANFFHGVFMLVGVLLLIPVIGLIPKAALAAMLVAIALRLASPKQFAGTYKVGPEQLVIFLVTLIVTVFYDLLWGVAAGMVMKLVFHLLNGAPMGSLFRADYTLTEHRDGYTILVGGAATFSNFPGYRRLWKRLDLRRDVHFNFADARLVDHSFMEQLHRFEETVQAAGGHVSWTGLEKFSPFSNHPLAARKASAGAAGKIEITLTPRQVDLRMFADKNELNFYPQKVRNAAKYKDFPIQKGNRVLYEENILVRYTDYGKMEVSDVSLSEGIHPEQNDLQMTVVHVSDLNMAIPDFALEPEDLWTMFSELTFSKDIDFADHPEFSSRYYLRGEDEVPIRGFFSEGLIMFLETHGQLHMESHRGKLLVYKKRHLLTTGEIQDVLRFITEFIRISMRRATQYV